MRVVSKLVITTLAGVVVANFMSQALAQDAVRDGAIHKCIVEAQARFPNVSDDSSQRARTDVYRSCMRAAGQNP
jgi:hypothetical protein